jgi:flavorubredoxin
MKTLIAYYSRSGVTAKLAALLAEALNADIVKLECRKYRLAGVGYLMAGYDSVKGNLPNIEVSPVDFEKYDLVVFGSPIWTSYPALPLRSLLSESPALKRAAAFVTFGGHSAPAKAFDMIQDNLTVDLEATLAVRSDDVNDGKSTSAINSFLAKLRSIDSN